MAKKLIATCATLMCTAGFAHAVEATGTLNVTATVDNACVVSTTDVAFGNVGVSSAESTGTITVTCTNASNLDIALDGGSSADISARTLEHDTVAATAFNYQLYTTAGRTTVWGDGTTGSTVASVGPVSTLTVYGSTTSTPTLPGSYADSVQVTVTF